MLGKTKEVGVRLSVTNKEVAERAMNDFGRTGVDALRKIDNAAKPVSVSLMAVSAAASKGREAFFGLAASVVGLVSIAGIRSIGEIAHGIAEIGDQATRAGLSLKTFQELKFVGEQNRIGVDSLADGIKELNLRADEFIVTGGGPAAEAFARLGFNSTDLAEKLKDPSALFSEIIGKLGQLDRAGAIRIADEVFGGSAGERFVQLIDQGQDGIRRTIDEAHKLGAVMDDEMIAKAAEVDRLFNALSNTVGTTLKGAIVEAAFALQQFIDKFNATSEQQTSTLDQRLRDLGRERLGIENSLLETPRPARGDTRKQRLEAILVEERDILKSLADRRPIVVPAPAIDGLGTGAGDWSKFATTFAPTGRPSRVAEISQDAKDLAGELENSETFMQGLQGSLRDFAEEAHITGREVGDALIGGAQRFEDAWISALQTGKFEWQDLVKQMLLDIARMSTRNLITGPLASLVGGLFGGGNLGNDIGGGISGAFTGGKLKFANGGVLSGSGISAFSSSVVSHPTTFPFAKGIGLMGEAGPEAIIPLKRGADGRLGVGGGAGNVTVNFNPVTNIDGSNLSQDQLAWVLEQNNKQLLAQVVPMVRKAMKGGHFG